MQGDIGERTNRGGRPPGSKNKVGADAKRVIAEAASELGGAARLTEWAKSDPQHERYFWTQIYTKLVPHKIEGDPDSPLHVVTTVELVAAGVIGQDGDGKD